MLSSAEAIIKFGPMRKPSRLYKAVLFCRRDGCGPFHATVEISVITQYNGHCRLVKSLASK